MSAAARTPRSCTLLAVAAALALLGLLAPSPTATASNATASTAMVASARLSVTSLGPELVTARSVVRIAGTVTNTGTVALDQVQVRLRVVGGRLGTRVTLDQWLVGEDVRQGVPVAPVLTLPRPLASGSRAPFVLAVPAAALGLAGQEFGAYPVALEVRATPTGQQRQQVAFLRTTVQWQPASKQYAVQRITWVLPITGLLTSPGQDQLTVQQLAAQLAPGSRMHRMLVAAATPGVVWAVDPHLLTTLQDAAGPSLAPGSTPTSTPGAPPAPTTTTQDPQTAAARAVVRDYLAALRRAAAGREVFELPYADPDLQVVDDAGAMELVTAARRAGSGRTRAVLGVPTRTDVAWPADGYASDRLVRDLASQGQRSLLLDGRTRPLVEPVAYTTDARTTSLPGSTTGLLVDGQLSELVGALRTPDALSRNRFLAATAAATTERPGLTRRLLVAVPRGSDPHPEALRGLVQARVPWLAPSSLAELSQPIGERGDTADLPRRAAPPVQPSRTRAGVRVPDVGTASDLRADVAGLGEVVADPDGSTVPLLQRAALELVSAGWRGQRRELLARQERQRARIAGLSGQLRVLPSTITFLRSEGQLQLTISNDLAQRVEGLRLRVVAPSPKLLVRQEVLTVPELGPGTRTSVRIPVRAIASGEVTLQAQLLAPSGALIGQAERVDVRVRPTDGWVLTIGGVAVALVLAVGLVRALRRPRRLTAAATPTTVEDPTIASQTVTSPTAETPEPPEPGR